MPPTFAANHFAPFAANGAATAATSLSPCPPYLSQDVARLLPTSGTFATHSGATGGTSIAPRAFARATTSSTFPTIVPTAARNGTKTMPRRTSGQYGDREAALSPEPPLQPLQDGPRRHDDRRRPDERAEEGEEDPERAEDEPKDEDHGEDVSRDVGPRCVHLELLRRLGRLSRGRALACEESSSRRRILAMRDARLGPTSPLPSRSSPSSFPRFGGISGAGARPARLHARPDRGERPHQRVHLPVGRRPPRPVRADLRPLREALDRDARLREDVLVLRALRERQLRSSRSPPLRRR